MNTRLLIAGIAVVGASSARADEWQARIAEEYRLVTARCVAAGEPLIVAVGGATVAADPGYAIWSVPSYQGDPSPRAIVTMPIAGAARVVGTIPGRVVERPAIFPILRRWSDNRRWRYDPPRQVVEVQPPRQHPVGVVYPIQPAAVVGVVAAPYASGVMQPRGTISSCPCGPNCPCRVSPAGNFPVSPSGAPATTPTIGRPHLTYRAACDVAKRTGRPIVVCVAADCERLLASAASHGVEVASVPSWDRDNLGREPRYLLCVPDGASRIWCVGRWSKEPAIEQIMAVERDGRAMLDRAIVSPIACADGQ